MSRFPETRHYRFRETGRLTSVNGRKPFNFDPADWEPITPVPVALVTDELLAGLTSVICDEDEFTSEFRRRVADLCDALDAGRPKPGEEKTDG